MGESAVEGVAVVFPGQGSQFVGMADPWASDPIAAQTLSQASEAMGRDVIDACRDEVALSTTEFVQPALLAVGAAAFRTLEARGLPQPVGAAGHSLGEFAALVASEAIDLRDALELVVIRGRAMQRAGEERPGTMTALLGIGPEDAAVLCDEVRNDDVLVVANENSPAQVVISGTIPAIERAESAAKERRVRAVRLRVAGAFHSPLMEPAVEPIREALSGIELRAPRFPVAENVSGELETDPATLRELLVRQVVSPVRWARCAQALATSGAQLFVEAGAGDVLTKLAKRAVPDARAVSFGTPDAMLTVR